MQTTQKTRTFLMLLLSILLLAGPVFFPDKTFAHCDTLEGPVVAAARVALEKGDISPVLKWVRPEDETVIKEAFDRTLSVRTQSVEARELADLYFFETLVRIHRAGEGVAYTGLKPAEEVDPAVALADQALENGKVDNLVNMLTNAMGKGIRSRFANALEKRSHADDSVAAGREFVESYVVFTHYVEGLHSLIAGESMHHGEAEGH